MVTRAVDFLREALDYGDAPGILASGLRWMFLVSPNIIRVTFVRADRDDQGRQLQRVCCHMDFDVSELPGIIDLLREGLTALIEQPNRVAPRTSTTTH